MEGWTALLLGLGGSLHCAGMCGPLVLALPARPGGQSAFFAGHLVHHAGRLATYGALGALAGGLGGGLIALSPDSFAWQQGLSLVVGGVILLATLLGLAHSRLPLTHLPTRLVGTLRRALARALPLTSPGGRLLTGGLNGLLPCGLVYVAAGGAATTGGTTAGLTYMLLFGAGTVPMLLATAWLGRRLATPVLHSLTRHLVPASALTVGALLVLRGLGLGIPFVSPALGAAACH